MKQPHSSVPLAKRKEMRLLLDLATGRPPEEELPQMAHVLVVAWQQQMEATRRQGSSNRCLAGQAMTRWYQLRAGDAQYAVGDRGCRHWRTTGNVGRPYIVLQRLVAVTYKLDIGTSKWWHIVHIDRLWAVVKERYLWGQQGPLSSPDSEVRSNSVVVGDGDKNNVAECVVGVRESPGEEAWSEPCLSQPLRTRKRPQ
ncbi:hypothetical protein E2C01_055290 [Portunus trituberculatus]|uniref:Uncharacterized protein n=1 Tax=Portunus trituberculatus TaxID=210409 RepID=A0A5B7GX87_PORTR|nr:hypothetical protein [Portunus trituberculatus]